MKDDQIKIAPQSKSNSFCPILTIELFLNFNQVRFYQPFFSIDTRDIRMRLFCAFLPKKPEFFQIIGKNIDLYIFIFLRKMGAYLGEYNNHIFALFSWQFFELSILKCFNCLFIF
jgi:hypothetical protein